MKKPIIINISVILATIAFNLLFWKEGMGVNTLIFTLLLILGIFIIDKEIFRNRTMQIITLGTIMFACSVVLNNSLFSKVLFVISFILMAGFSQQQSVKFLGSGFVIGLWSFMETPFKIINNLPEVKGIKINWWKNIKLFFIPMVVVSLFFLVYCLANQKFAMIFINTLDSIFEFLSDLEISWVRLLFILLGFCIAGGLLLKNKKQFSIDDNNENIERKKEKRIVAPLFAHSFMALKNEYKIGLITIFSLNVLILLVNITDVQHLWFADVESFNIWELKGFVYQGTYVLILSIVMAMAVLIYFFRENLNFYPNNKILKIGAYIWIAQNAILALSVGIRNYRYIEYYGVAYKRIGVFIFLSLTFIGLLTMLSKVKNKKSIHFLLHKNAWVWYAVFLLVSFVNWDLMISEYNIQATYGSEIDLDYLFNDVSDKNIYLLEENKDILEERSSWSEKDIRMALDNKEYEFRNKVKSRTCLSWNLPDSKNLKELD